MLTSIIAGLAALISILTFVSGQLALRNSARLSVIHALEERVKELEAKVLHLELREQELLGEKLTLMERLLGVTYRTPVSP